MGNEREKCNRHVRCSHPASCGNKIPTTNSHPQTKRGIGTNSPLPMSNLSAKSHLKIPMPFPSNCQTRCKGEDVFKETGVVSRLASEDCRANLSKLFQFSFVSFTKAYLEYSFVFKFASPDRHALGPYSYQLHELS